MGNRKIIYTVGWPRSGNKWFSRLLSDLFSAPIVTSGNDGDERFAEEIGDEYEVYMTHWYRNAYQDRGYPNPVFHIIRDPRDVAVSLMFYRQYQNISHALNVMYEDGYVSFIENWLREPAHGAFKYESFHGKSSGMANLLWIWNYVTDKPIAPERAAAILERQKFDKWLSLDRRAHRRGIIGEWREYINRDVAKMVEVLYGDLLRELGYESTRRWWENVPK